ncbi:hypothetical protein AAFN88_14950 [Pelagibius sp. CAU 1746]|uniref:hypothetical protein n=1 Tax=Pelagibius sp. CAU 1746 TaxID=3140370 RepID=UPI00325A43CB
MFALLGVGLIWSGSAIARDIPRDGKIEVPSKEEAIALCRKNPYIDNNILLASCVQIEQQSAQRILGMISKDRDSASVAYWNCVKNPYIDNFQLLAGCMDQELEAAKFLGQ